MNATLEEVFLDELVTATTEVFSTMVFTDVTPGTPVAGGDGVRGGPHVVGTIAFTGKTNGLVVFYTGMDVAKQITASMLGMDADAVGDELHDAIGELTNMIGGSFRTKVAHSQNETWAISVPQVTVGNDFYTRFVANVQRLLCPFKLGDNEVFVELIVTKRQ